MNFDNFKCILKNLVKEEWIRVVIETAVKELVKTKDKIKFKEIIGPDLKRWFNLLGVENMNSKAIVRKEIEIVLEVLEND